MEIMGDYAPRHVIGGRPAERNLFSPETPRAVVSDPPVWPMRVGKSVTPLSFSFLIGEQVIVPALQ